MNAKWLRKYTARQEKKIWKAKCRADKSIIYDNIYKAASNGKYNCISSIARMERLEVINNITIRNITQELEKKGFCVVVTSDYLYNTSKISWSEKKKLNFF